jgi:hypothetical protein
LQLILPSKHSPENEFQLFFLISLFTLLKYLVFLPTTTNGISAPLRALTTERRFFRSSIVPTFNINWSGRLNFVLLVAEILLFDFL